MYEELERYPEAVHACLEARDIVKPNGQISKAQVAQLGLALANVRIKAGELEEAAQQLGGLRTAIDALDDIELTGLLRSVEGEHAQARGNLPEAQRLLEASLESFKQSESGREYKVSAVRLDLAEVVLQRGDRGYAVELLEAVLTSERFDSRRLREKARAMKVELEQTDSPSSGGEASSAAPETGAYRRQRAD